MHTPYSSATSTVFFLSIFLIAFFPGAFNYLVQLPLLILSAPFRTPPPSTSSPLPLVPLPAMSGWFQKTLTMPARGRGSYLITSDVMSSLPEIKNYKVGILHLFVQHTSCGLSLNENYDSDVRADMSDALDRIVPEDKKGQGLYRHDAEGSDDMPVRFLSP